RPQPSGDLDDLVVEEVQARDCVRRFRLGRFLVDANGPSLLVELDDTVSFRIADPIGEHGGAVLLPGRGPKIVRQVRAVKDVVSKRERDTIVPDELLPDEKGLREALRGWLHGILNGQADVTAVAEEPLESVLLVRRRDHLDVADARQHQRRERIVDEWFIEDGQELFADGPGQRVQPRPRAASENYSL